MEKEIKSICLDFPNCDDGTSIYYCVGKPPCGSKDPVTKIKKVEKYTEFCKIYYFEIWTSDKLFAEMHQYGHIIYF